MRFSEWFYGKFIFNRIGYSNKTVLSQGDLGMPEYLSKEEVRQWRSSLERITLEEYAARLGKVLQGEKQTNDIVDKVMTKSLNTISSDSYVMKNEKIETIAMKSFEKEKEIMATRSMPKQAPVIKKQVMKKTIETKIESVIEAVDSARDDMNLSFKKSLTNREQMIFDYFLSNKNTIVYAKDLAKILELPRDYVYKYIKNLRSKLNEDVLYNADNGGYVLKV